MVRSEQPFQFTHAIIEWDFLTCLTSTVPTGFVRTSRGLLPYTWGWDISVVWSVNPEFLHLYQTVWKTTTPRTSGIKIVSAFWSLLNPYKEDWGSSQGLYQFCVLQESITPSQRYMILSTLWVRILSFLDLRSSIWCGNTYVPVHATHLGKHMGNMLLS